jgi:hypothetical protein
MLGTQCQVYTFKCMLGTQCQVYTVECILGTQCQVYTVECILGTQCQVYTVKCMLGTQCQVYTVECMLGTQTHWTGTMFRIKTCLCASANLLRTNNSYVITNEFVSAAFRYFSLLWTYLPGGQLWLFKVSVQEMYTNEFFIFFLTLGGGIVRSDE